MWVEKLPSGKYRVGDRYKDPYTGAWKKISVTIDKNTKKEIRTAEQIIEKRINDKLSTTESGKITFDTLKDKYLEYKKITVKESSYRTYKCACNKICEIIGKDVIIDNLNVSYIQAQLLKTDEDLSSLNNKIETFKRIMNWGYRNELVNNISSAEKLEYFHVEQDDGNIEDKYLESSEAKLLIDKQEGKWAQNISKFLLLTGMRIGEALCLTTNDINLKTREISVTKTYNDVLCVVLDRPKTSSSNRKVYIQDELLPFVAELRKVALSNKLKGKSSYIFQDKNGEIIRYATYRNNLEKESIRILNRKVTPHIFRHTHVSLLAENGMTLEEIGRRIGHGDDSKITKKVYFHVTKKLKEKDNERIKKVKII